MGEFAATWSFPFVRLNGLGRWQLGWYCARAECFRLLLSSLLAFIPFQSIKRSHWLCAMGKCMKCKSECQQLQKCKYSRKEKKKKKVSSKKKKKKKISKEKKKKKKKKK